MPTYVVEHLDAELYQWSILEYKSALEFVSPSPVIFSNFPFDSPSEWNGQNNYQAIKENIQDFDIPMNKICLLDSESPNLLEPKDATEFTHFLYGGILGNTDEFDFDRTKVLRELGFPTRSLGQVQMSTDTAIKVTKLVIEDKIHFEDIEFIDRPVIQTAGAHESLVLNFRYLKDPNGEPLIAPGIVELLLSDIDVFDEQRLE